MSKQPDEDLRMDAYYYGFAKTGIVEIDRILSAVATAGKHYHSTEDWGDKEITAIQTAANDAAKCLVPNTEVEQRCLEAEIGLLKEQEQGYNDAISNGLPETKYVFQPIIAGIRTARQKREAQLTNLQNKEDK